MKKAEVVQYIPPFKEFAIGVAVRSGTILMRNFTDNVKRRPIKKSRFEIVTQSDKEVHRFISYKIRQQFPDHNFISEEGAMIDRGSSYTWVTDPLDGTLNYTIGNPFFSTSITLLKDNDPVIGVVYAPFTREMFVVEKGRSVRLNERNIRVSKERKLENAVFSYSYFYRDRVSRNRSMKLLAALEDRSRSMRHLGCTTLELAYVAAGRMEACVYSPPLRMWDVAAGMLMVEVAGGRVTNFTGEAWKGLQDGLLASNGLIHKQILAILKTQRI